MGHSKNGIAGKRRGDSKEPKREAPRADGKDFLPCGSDSESCGGEAGNKVAQPGKRTSVQVGELFMNDMNGSTASKKHKTGRKVQGQGLNGIDFQTT